MKGKAQKVFSSLRAKPKLFRAVMTLCFRDKNTLLAAPWQKKGNGSWIRQNSKYPWQAPVVRVDRGKDGWRFRVPDHVGKYMDSGPECRHHADLYLLSLGWILL